MKIRNIKINFDQIVLFLILLPVFVDQINGFMQAEMNLSFSVGQAVKFFYMLGLTVFLVRSNRKVTVVVLYVFSMLSIPVIITIFSKRLIYLSVFSDLIFIFKLTTFLITFYVMRYLFTNYRQYFNEELLYKVTFWLFYIILAALIASVFGFGRGMYGDVNNVKVGFKGYFIAGNELSNLYLVVYAHYLFFIISRKSSTTKILFTIFMGMLCAVLMSTKTALLSFVIVTAAVPSLDYFFSGGTFLSLIKRNIYRLAGALMFLFISLVGVYFTFKENIDSYIVRVKHSLKMSDSFLTFLLSSRNHRYEDSFTIFNEYSLIDKIFGTGWTYPQHFIENRLYGWGSAETDWLDLLVAQGVVGVLLIYSIWIAILLMTYARYRSHKNPFSVPALIVMGLLFINTTFSGHILYSAMIGMYLAFFISFQFVNYREEK